MNLLNLFAKIVLDKKEYEDGLTDSKKMAESFKSKIVTVMGNVQKAWLGFVGTVTAAGGAIYGFAKKASDVGGDIDDNAKKLGVSTEAYQFWDLTLQRAGTDVSQLSAGIRKMTEFTQQLTAGNGDALIALEEMGIGYQEFMDMKPEDQLWALVEGLQGVEDGNKKVELAQEVFGNRTYQELMPLLEMEQGSLDELNQEWHDHNLILSDEAVKSMADAGDGFDLIERKVGLLFAGLGEKLIPVVEWFINFITENIGTVTAIAVALGVVTTAIVGVNLALNANPIGLIVTAVGALLVALTGLVAWVVENWDKVKATVIDPIINFFTVIFPEAISNLWNWIDTKLLKPLGEAFKWVGNLFVDIINGMISGFEGFLNFFVRGINGIFNTINKISIDFPDWLGGGHLGFSIPLMNEVKLGRVKYFKEGGMLDNLKGTMYAIAGESGAEIVAQGKHGTGVANVEQIADAQYMAMQDYGLREIIGNAVTGIVNGLLDGFSMRGKQSTNGDAMVVKIGEKEFKGYVVDTINSTLQGKGRKSLYAVTSY